MIARFRSTFTLVSVLLCFLAMGFLMIRVFDEWAKPRSFSEIHRMHWANEPYGGCTTYVTLEFETAPGYVIQTCNAALLQSLVQEGVNPVDVEMMRTDSKQMFFLPFTTHAYQIIRIGTWHGTTQYDGIATRCTFFSNTNTATSPCAKTPSPIQQPYTLQ